LKVEVSCRHIVLPEAIKEYARQKAQRLVRYYDRIQEIKVILNADGGGTKCELVVDVAGSHNFVAEAGGKDVREVIDAAVDKLQVQLKRHKERRHSHSSEGRRKGLRLNRTPDANRGDKRPLRGSCPEDPASGSERRPVFRRTQE